MAKKASTTSAPVAEVNEQKKRKQQAKREAKMMLEIEETKVSIEKAEKKTCSSTDKTRGTQCTSPHA